MISDHEAMAMARGEAKAGMAEGGEPVGSVIVKDGEVLGRGRNRLRQDGDPTAHAEMEAYRAAARQVGRSHAVEVVESMLHGATVFTTAMPCEMCAGAILRFKAPRVVVAEVTSYKPAGTQALMERQGLIVDVLDDQATLAMVEDHLRAYPDRREAHEHGDDRPQHFRTSRNCVAPVVATGTAC